MRCKYVIFLAILTISALAGCQNDETDINVAKTFPTEKEAIHQFLKENPNSDVERISTTNEENIFLKRSGNNQYSFHDMKSVDDGYSVVKITVTLSLHNTIAGSSEVTTTKGEDYTFQIVKKGKLEELPSAERNHSFSDLYRGDIKLSLIERHTAESSNGSFTENVIDSTDTISD
ncbi:hypothetical protein [Salimicrobium flavidum]|uniref:Uncharacterized protein n=1 Tax=Salimicrobium flavidum TaxID=570947 RepID=A0A1N7J7V5_9BACI|nr:hypothetical protein [Salimicrobium flavidum]SIS45448.1 hypothetical protein SAMN05421687_104109 [Salimicrobium flavidum]